MKNKTYKRDHTHFEILLLLLFVYGDGIFNMVALSGKKKEKENVYGSYYYYYYFWCDVLKSTNTIKETC